MKIMSSAKEFSNIPEFENNSHIARKKKAVESQFQKKNFKQIVEMINDEDDEVSEKYARYIK